MESEPVKIDKLVNCENWSVWKFQLKVMMKDSQLWDVVTGVKVKPEPGGAVVVAKWTKLNNKAQRLVTKIVTTIGQEPMLHIMNYDTSADMWAKLESVYAQKSETSIHLLQQQFFNYSKDLDDPIAVHISKLQKLAILGIY